MVVFECDGHFSDSIPKIFKKFLTECLPFSSYEYAQLLDIEVYSISDENSKGGHSEVWIQLRKQNNIRILRRKKMNYEIEIRDIEPIRVATMRYKERLRPWITISKIC